MGKGFKHNQGRYAHARRKAEKDWENGDRDFKPGGRTWETVAQLKAMAYPDFLRSKYWQDNRRSFLNAAKYRCQKCKAQDVELHVHHNTYEHLGQEWLYPEDVMVLCKECHEKEHGIE